MAAPHEHNTPVPQFQQMLQGYPGSCLLCTHDIGGTLYLPIAIDKNQRCTDSHLLIEIFLQHLRIGADDNQAGHIAGYQFPGRSLLLGRVIAGTGQQQGILVVADCGLNAVNDLRKKHIIQTRHHHTDSCGMTQIQLTGLDIGHIMQFFDGSLHAQAGLFAHRIILVHHAGDGSH